MSFPIISHFAQSVSQPHGLFSTLGEPVCENDIYGRPKMTVGGSAVVFKVMIGTAKYALKCYIKPRPRTRLICDELSRTKAGPLLGASYHPGEIFVYGADGAGTYYDVCLTPWAEGHTLENRTRKALHDNDGDALHSLATMFDRMALELLESEWAHGDLKPENIIVGPHGEMKLIDYDAMYFPAFNGSETEELGTPHYQHPNRDSKFFNRHMDDYSIALISATLHMLAEDPQLHHKFRDADHFLFSPRKIFEGVCPAYTHARDVASRLGDAALYTLITFLASPEPEIKGLSEILKYISEEKTNSLPELDVYADSSRWGYNFKNGDRAIPPIYDRALEFSEGLAAVVIGGSNHFVGPDGRCKIDCSGYDAVKSFSCGVAAVRKGGLWGYIDMGGNIMVEPRFLKASTVRDGKVRVANEAGNIIETDIMNLKTSCTKQG